MNTSKGKGKSPGRQNERHGTIVLPCHCRHQFQDAEYGRGLRLHNVMAKKASGQQTARCTVCGSVRPVRE